MKNNGLERVIETLGNRIITKLKYVSSINGRIGFRGYTQNDLVDEGDGAITISPSNIKGMNTDFSKCTYVSWYKYNESPEIKVCKGDIILVKTGSSYGKSALIQNLPQPATINPQLVVLKDIKINKKILFYFLQTDFVKRQMDLAVIGGAIPTMTQVKIGNTILILPPLSEQKAIAEFLDKKCGEVDALIADIQQEIETLEQYKRSVITESVTKGLDPSVPMIDSGIDWVGIMPKHWKKMPNKYLMYKAKTICPVYNGESILSLTMKGVVVRDLEAGGKMPTSFDGYQQIKAGNLLMCLFDIDVTPRCIGLICNNGVTSPAYSQFIMKKNAYAPFYSYYYLMVDFTKELLHMAKNLRHSLNEEQFGAILAPVPPIEEQQQIADYLDKKCKEIEGVIADKQSQIETLESYKKSLIYEYVTGKKEVG